MDLESVQRYLEEGGGSDNEKDKMKKTIDGLPHLFFQPLVMAGLRVHLLQPGRVICSMRVPPRLLTTGNFLDDGATATIVDMVGGAVMFTAGCPETGVSLEINISYLDAAYADEEIEIEGKALRVGKVIGVVTVELRKKETGKIIAHGRHTKYLAMPSKI